MKNRKSILGLTLLTLLGTSLVTGCNEQKQEGVGYVTIETNPSVELVVDGDSVVVAVNGLNEDGKLLLNGEEIEGLTIEEATKKIIELTEQLGFTVQGEIDTESQEIKISVSASNEEFKANLEATVKEETQKVIDYLNIDAKIQEVEAKTREYFEAVILDNNPTLTEEEVKAMTEEQIYDALEGIVEEKAQFASVKLEEYYEDLKAYEFKFKNKEELAASLAEANQVMALVYNKAVEGLKSAIETVRKAHVDFLTSPDSGYVKAVNELNAKKDEVIALRVEIGSMEKQGEVSETLLSALDAAEKVLDNCSAALDSVQEAFNVTMGTLLNGLNTALTTLESMEATFVNDIDFEKELTDAETYINENKAELFAKFEESISKEKLAEIEAEIVARKEALKTQVSGIKSNTNK